MLTHVTVELPQVIVAAGLPIVCVLVYGYVSVADPTLIRILLANPSSVTQWVGTVPSLSISRLSRLLQINIGLHQPFLPFATPPKCLGEKRLSRVT